MLVELSLVEQRYDAVKEVLNDGLSVTEVAERYQVARQTLHRWIRRYRLGGLVALVDQPRKPASCPHQMCEEIEVLICELRRSHDHWGPRRLVHELERRGVVPVPGRSSVYRALVRNGLIEPKTRRRRRDDYRRWERARPMELWQLDVMKLKLSTGKWVNVICAIDDHSRFCVAAQVAERATSQAVCHAFSKAMRSYGVPDQILTDNAKVFTARFGSRQGEVLFDRICRENGVDHILTGVRSPTTTGKVERFHKTLRTELFTRSKFASTEEAQEALDDYLVEYNDTRPHQSIGMVTPSERFLKGERTEPAPREVEIPAIDPSHRMKNPNEFQRRVDFGGRIGVGGVLYGVGRPYGGEIVTVQLVGDLLHIYLRDQLLRVHPKRHKKEVKHVTVKSSWTNNKQAG